MSNGPQRTSDPTENRYSEGDLIQGKYKLTHPIGEGGMGVVWAAHNVVLNVDVALKLIQKVSGDPEISSLRFLQEARTAAQLAHPAICRVFDYGQTNRRDPFIVCELLSGESLGAHIEEHGRMPAAQAIQTILPIVDGLSVAHALGIVHRDVKSDNIFLSRDIAGRTQPKLLDFGVARCIHDTNKITLAGTLLGTPNYMSPEQARGDSDYDSRTDIWSLCIVIYELVTGMTPFEGENYNAVLWNILNASPKPILEHGAGNAELWGILAKGLRKNADDRWTSMRELGGALALWLCERGLSEDICAASLRATWVDLGGGSSPFGSPMPEAASSRGSYDTFAPSSESYRHLREPIRSSDSTLPGVARTDARRKGARHLTPLILGAVGLCVATFAAWLLIVHVGQRRAELVLATSIRTATTNVATALPPVVNVEDLAVDPRAGPATPPSDAGIRGPRAPEADGAARPRGAATDGTSRSPTAAPSKRRRSDHVDFGF